MLVQVAHVGVFSSITRAVHLILLGRLGGLLGLGRGASRPIRAIYTDSKPQQGFAPLSSRYFLLSFMSESCSAFFRDALLLSEDSLAMWRITLNEQEVGPCSVDVCAGMSTFDTSDCMRRAYALCVCVVLVGKQAQ
jgi:hypothetical protein